MEGGEGRRGCKIFPGLGGVGLGSGGSYLATRARSTMVVK